MIDTEYCVLMARYAQWMNTRLHELVCTLPDNERRRDRGAFFGSIHETCNHLLWGDRIWFARFTGATFMVGNYGRGLIDNFADIVRERAVADDAIVQWSKAIDDGWLSGMLTYTSAMDGRARTLSRAKAVVHFFNHGTHHRGQLTTLMKQAGVEPGVTDLPLMPDAL